MSKSARSARGETIDFDLLAIKQQLSTTPVPVGVNARRRFIDEKDGLKTRENSIYTPEPMSAAMSKSLSQQQVPQSEPEVEGNPLAVAIESAKVSAETK